MRQVPRCTLLACLCLTACLMSACGGGGSSGGPATYAIGGSVTGLTQLSGVVLENNGGDALTVSANGNFTFSTRETSSESYNITVETQPSGETCTLGGTTQGTVSGAVSVSVSCTSNYANTSAANVAAISVNAGPGSPTGCDGGTCQTFNIPLVTVTVCNPSTPTTCATIQNVLVDTGSSGLRLISSALPSGFTLPSMTDPAGGSNDIFECSPFADGYTWGGVVEATVSVGGETTTPPPGLTGVPVQIVNSSPDLADIPNGCTQNAGSDMDSVNDFDANGVLGVGLADQDCGTGCDGVYWSCPTSGCIASSASYESFPVANQVANPVASFPTDSNGVIVQLPAISASGAVSASGYLVFGIGTETASGTEADNSLNGATVLAAGGPDIDLIATTFSDQNDLIGFIDSGSNGLYFPQPTPNLALCGNSAPANEFYCPTSTTTLSATNEGVDANDIPTGPTSNVSFQVADLNNISDTDFAINDVGGTTTAIDGVTGYFDWGLPFFYGRTVFVAINGLSADGTTGPYWAY